MPFARATRPSSALGPRGGPTPGLIPGAPYGAARAFARPCPAGLAVGHLGERHSGLYQAALPERWFWTRCPQVRRWAVGSGWRMPPRNRLLLVGGRWWMNARQRAVETRPGPGGGR